MIGSINVEENFQLSQQLGKYLAWSVYKKPNMYVTSPHPPLVDFPRIVMVSLGVNFFLICIMQN